MRPTRLLPALLLIGLLPALLLAGASVAQAQMPQKAHPTGPVKASGEKGRVTGKIEGAPEGVSPAGAKVVLMRYRLNAQGVPEGSEFQTQITTVQGAYAFAGVPIELGTVYTLSAAIGERSLNSQPFSFAGGGAMEVNLPFPRVSQDVTGLSIDESLLVVEARPGSVLVTQVVHLFNSSSDFIDGSSRPLELQVPAAATALEVVRGIEPTAGYERLGNRMLIAGNLPPGRTTVAVRYQMKVWLGSVSFAPEYSYPVGAFTVLAPEHTLTLRSGNLQAQDARAFQETRYDIWASQDLAARQTLPFTLAGVPLRQEVYLLPAGLFVLLMGGVVVWFVRRRLPREAPGS